MSGGSNGRDDLEEEIRGLKNILSVAQVVVSSLNLDEVLDNILGSALAIMEMPAGSIALYDQQSHRLELHAHFGLSDAFVNRSSWTVKEGGLTATILSRGELFVVEDTSQTDFFNNPLAINEGIRSLVAMPLMIQNNIVGIIYLNDFVPRQCPASQRKLLPILGSFASMSIDNARLHERTRELACTDGLTGLHNHSQFKKNFSEELIRARRYQKPLALIMLDIDDFKQFNDLYGHPVGDKILIVVAGILADTVRDCDNTYRYGGEEFIAILPEAELAEALTAAERIRERIARETISLLDSHVQHTITVSVGVAVYPRDNQSFDGLLKIVDDLLYAAKRQGKNKVYHLPE